MKQLTALLSMVAFAVGLAHLTVAQQTTSQPSPLTGIVVSIDTTGGSIVLATKGKQQVAVMADAKTKVRVNAAEAGLTDVKPGMSIGVRSFAGLATDIRAYSPLGAAATRPSSDPFDYEGVVVSTDGIRKVTILKDDGKQETVEDTPSEIWLFLEDTYRGIGNDVGLANMGDLLPDMRVKVRRAPGTAPYHYIIRFRRPQTGSASQPATSQESRTRG